MNKNRRHRSQLCLFAASRASRFFAKIGGVSSLFSKKTHKGLDEASSVTLLLSFKPPPPPHPRRRDLRALFPQIRPPLPPTSALQALIIDVYWQNRAWPLFFLNGIRVKIPDFINSQHLNSMTTKAAYGSLSLPLYSYLL